MKKAKKYIAMMTAAAVTAMSAMSFMADETTENTEASTQAAMDNQIDMSALTLPEGFKPFDEEHVPDGTNAPENGELKPVTFDENGTMTYGQKPEGAPESMPGEMNANGSSVGKPADFKPFDEEHVPDGTYGEVSEEELKKPEQTEGERPELPEGEEGQAPQNNGGQAPQDNGGQMPQDNGGQAPQDNGGQAPQNNGGQAPQDNGVQAPQNNGGQAPQNNGGQALQNIGRR